MNRFAPALAALLLLALPSGLLAQSLYTANKAQVYFQTSATAVTPQPYAYVMAFGTPSANQVTGPSGTFAIPLISSEARLRNAYHTQAALDAAFPNGTYTFTGPPSYSVNLTGNLYASSVPQVIGGSGTWTNGVLVVDPTQDTVLQFSTFSTYASGAGSHEQFKYSAQDGTNAGATQDLVSVPLLGITQSAQPFTTYTIPKNTLKAGTLYQGQLQFDSISSLDTSSVSGGALVSFYTQAMQFYIAGKPASAPAAPTLNTVADVSGLAGSTVTIAVTGTGLNSGTSTASWFHNGIELDFSSGRYGIMNGSSLTISNFGAADTGGYYVVIANSNGLAISNEAKVTLGTPPPPVTVPVITAQPQSVNVVAGSTAVFNVTATGTGLHYQWYINNLLLGGATSSRLLLQNVTASASYYCVISNSAGAVNTVPVQLTIVSFSANQVSRLINESVLSNVPTGGSLTVGYTVGGQGVSSSAGQSLLIRGDGPTLGALIGSAGTMADPNLKVIPLGTQTVVANNDNWGANQAQIIAADAATGAFPLVIGSLDAALVSNFTAGGYSAIVSPNTTGGSVLAELYDNTSAGSYSATSPHLINLSVIAPVSGGGTLSAGFVVSGSTSRTVLIRAMGPALSTFGLAGLPDPTLTLVLQSSGVLVASNQGWGGDPLVSSIAASVNGFPFASATSLDSALLVTVSPGVTYTATAASASGASGQVLIEVYDVP